MAAAEDLSSFYDTVYGDAELVTVAGTTVAAIFDNASEVVLADAVVRAPTLRLPATVAAAVDDACTVRGAAYLVRQVIDLPPDAVERLLVLARG
jgi:hypothetical protein